jgi:hypothetical protein
MLQQFDNPANPKVRGRELSAWLYLYMHAILNIPA